MRVFSPPSIAIGRANWCRVLVAVFGDKRRSKAEDRHQYQQQEELRKNDAIIAEILAENLELKKRFRT